MKPRCIIMRGIPGSGKSTLAKTMGAAIVSADDFFMEKGTYRFDGSKLGEAHQRCMREFLGVTNVGNSVVVDNTNINLEDIAPYVAVAEARGYDVTIIQFDVAPDVAAQRNVHGVDEAGVKRMYNKLQSTRLPARWKVIRMGGDNSVPTSADAA